MKTLTLLIAACASILLAPAFGQEKKTLLYDTFHGENKMFGGTFNRLLPDSSNAEIGINSKAINETMLKGASGLILFSPKETFREAEKEAIVNYLRSGGSLLLLFDEERRMSLSEVGVNDIITPFGIELTEDTPTRHNCGAIAEKSEVCAEKRELPYSGGRSIIGGTVVSRVYDEGNYIHCAYVRLPGGGKIIVLSDGMVGFLMGEPDGIRFDGTGPSDSKYWGKDSYIFMQEILAFLIKD